MDVSAAGPQLTPTINAELVQRLGGFTTLCEGLDYAAQGQTGMNFYGPRGQLEVSLPYRTLRKRAIEVAHRLVNAGVNGIITDFPQVLNQLLAA